MSPAGGLAEEAARLLDAVQSWLGGAAAGFTASEASADAGAGAGDDADDRDGAPSAARDHPHHSGPECRVCPICQLLSVVRTAKPEVLAHLGDAMTSLAAAFAELVPTEAAATPRPPADEVEHIVVTGDDDAPPRKPRGAAWG